MGATQHRLQHARMSRGDFFARGNANRAAKSRNQFIGVEVKFNQRRLQKILERIPVIAQFAAYDSGLRPAAHVVKKKAEELVPRSARTGSSKKWSAKTRADRANVKPLHRSIAVKVVRPGGGQTPYAVVGPKRPEGNIAHFIAPLKKDTRAIVLWGRRTGRIGRKDDDFMRRAFDTTKQQQRRAFTRGVIKSVRAQLRGIGRG